MFLGRFVEKVLKFRPRLTDKVDMKREDGQLDWDETAEFATTRTREQLWDAIFALQQALPSARNLDRYCPNANNVSREGVYCDEISVYREELRVRGALPR